MARAIATCGEDVWIYCTGRDDAEELRIALECEVSGTEARWIGRRDYREGEDDGEKRKGRIRVGVCASDDTWIRDTGPTFLVRADGNDDGGVEGKGEGGDRAADNPVRDGGSGDEDRTSSPPLPDLIGIDWNFNAYGGPDCGGCYWPCDIDCAVAQNVISSLSAAYSSSLDICIERRETAEYLILEGGSFHVDGEGTILVTEECLLNPNRNPNLSREDIERILLRELVGGSGKVIWLPYGLAHDDDTNGHVDNLAAFVRPGSVLLSWTDDEVGDGDNYRRCREAERVLLTKRDAKGRSFEVMRLNLPDPMFYTEEEVRTLEAVDGAVPRIAGECLAASYANFYVANYGVIVPQFGDDKRDADAIKVLKSAFPEREVVGVYSREILLGGGNIHCITQQVPRPRLEIPITSQINI